jgi:hypothetical protein
VCLCLYLRLILGEEREGRQGMSDVCCLCWAGVDAELPDKLTLCMRST